MSEQLTVLYVVDDTVVEETFTAERITLQHYPDGRLQVTFWAGQQVARYVFYRQFERTHHVIDQALVPREERT